MKLRTSLPAQRILADRSDTRGDSSQKFLTVRLACSLIILGAALALMPNSFAQTSKPSETAKTQDAASPLSHDLSGVWMQYPQGDVPGTPGMNTVNQRFRPPLTPWGQARLDAARPLVGPKAVAGEENSPTLRCDPDGPPKVLNHPIWADGRALPKDPDPSYLGYAVGKWEGDTFVVETIGLNDKVWADAYGNPRSEQTRLTERYRRLNHDTLELQVTIDDPKSYTKVWVSPPKLHKLEAGWEIAEWFCAVEEDKAYDEVVRKPAGVSPASNK
jgi:hypothetical protein